MWMRVTQPRGNIIANFFKGHIKRRPDKVCFTLCCPLEKGHSQIGSKTESVWGKGEQNSSLAQIREKSLWNNEQFPLRSITCSTLPSYACETASCARKLASCHWQSNQISAERTTCLILSNKWSSDPLIQGHLKAFLSGCGTSQLRSCKVLLIIIWPSSVCFPYTCITKDAAGSIQT